MNYRQFIHLSWFGLVALMLFQVSAKAFESVDEQIASYLEIFKSGSYPASFEMLERLQWSGLSDPRLFDTFESLVLEKYKNASFNKNERNLVGYSIRSLGYSGNPKYRATLEEVKKNASASRLRGYAKRALSDMDHFELWHKKINSSDFRVVDKPVEIGMYMKMLSVDDPFVQRLAARAIFHERQTDPELLAMAAENLENQYLQSGLDGEAQDTAAWLCKAIGQSGQAEYTALLRKIADETPYKKIRKYASVDYAR